MRTELPYVMAHVLTFILDFSVENCLLCRVLLARFTPLLPESAMEHV